MQALFDKITELEGIPSYSKHQQLVQGIIHAIDEKILVRNDMLPSVNVMIKQFGIARETIVKAYKELIARGIIESKNRLGYFVINESTTQTKQIALVLFNYGSLQELFYKHFCTYLGDDIHVDLFFHHNNVHTLENIVRSIIGKYSMYVVVPLPHRQTQEVLKLLPMNKFLMIDRYEPLEGDFNYITQEFEEASYRIFVELKDRITDFDEFIFFYRINSETPVEIIRSFKKFLHDFQIKGSIKTAYTPGSVEKGKVYFTLENIELWSLLKDCKLKGYELGKDVGVLSHNDDLVKEILFDGITTYSADFIALAQKAAQYVLRPYKIQETLPTRLIRRKSL